MSGNSYQKYYAVFEVITLFFNYWEIKRSLLGLKIYPMYLLLPESTGLHKSQRFELDVPHIHFNLATPLFQQSVHTALQ